MARYAKISILSFEHYPMEPGEIDYKYYKDKIKRYLKSKIDKVLPDKPDLIIFPECCNRVDAFTPEQKIEFYLYIGDEMQKYISEIARENKVNIAYSAVRCVEDKEFPFRNSITFYDRNGNVAGIYDKNHLVVEENTISKIGYGEPPEKLIELDIGKIAPAICFDLNFDELLERYIKLKPDLIVFASYFYGNVIQNIWAYRCRAYFASAIVVHQNGRIISPFGEILARTTDNTEYATYKLNLDYEIVHIDYNAEKLEAAKRKYGEGFDVRDPGGVGCVIIESKMKDKSVQDIIKEFDIEIMDDYYDRARKHRNENYGGKNI